MKIERIIIVLVLCLFSCKSPVQETESQKPTPEFDFSKIEKFKSAKNTGPIVLDFDSIFESKEIDELSELLIKYDLKTTNQIVVVTVNNISPYSDIHKFSIDLANYWGVGRNDKNNGLTIVLCKPERNLAIATGYGTELILTDEICQDVIDSIMIPEFKSGNYYDGIKKGVTELITKWE